MSNALALALVLPTLLAATPAQPQTDGPAQARMKVALLPFSSGPGVEEAVAVAIGEPTAAEIRKRPGIQLITGQEISTLLGYERQRSLLDCRVDSCLAEIGGALGADQLAQGSLSKLGESWLVTLKLIDVRKVSVLAQSDRRLRKGTIDDVLDVLPQMVGEVLTPLGVPASPPPEEAARVRKNLLYVELIGNGFLTANYERTLVGAGQAVDFGVRLGVGASLVGMLDFSVGTPHHRLEIGAGVSKYFGASSANATATIGYRYLSSGKFMLRAGLTPMISLTNRELMTVDRKSFSWAPLAGFSAGWAF